MVEIKMIKQRIVEFKDGNGVIYYRCQSKGWFFWWYYRHGSQVAGIIKEFGTMIQANDFLMAAKIAKRGEIRRRVSVIKESDIPDYEWGSHCSIAKYEKLKEQLNHFDNV